MSMVLLIKPLELHVQAGDDPKNVSRIFSDRRGMHFFVIPDAVCLPTIIITQNTAIAKRTKLPLLLSSQSHPVNASS